MTEFIADRIMEAGRRSIEQGRTKFSAYFPKKTARYEERRQAVEQILRNEGYESCIVEVK